MTLTVAQKKLVNQVYEEAYSSARSCLTNHPRAEECVKGLLSPLMPDYEVHWVANPEEGSNLRYELGVKEFSFVSLREHAKDMVDNVVFDFRNYIHNLIEEEAAQRTNVVLDSQAALYRLIKKKGSPVPHLPMNASWTCYSLITMRANLANWITRQNPVYFNDNLNWVKSLEENTYCLWVLPKHVILCQKPERFVIVNGESTPIFHQGLTNQARPQSSLDLLLDG